MAHSRKLVLAVRDPALRARLALLLQGEDIEVEYQPDLTAERPEDIDADVVVLQADSLEARNLPDVIDSSGGDQAPGVVVLGRDETAANEVRLVAAGVSAVLDQDRGDLVEHLVELTEAEADGGLHGPEGGGHTAQPRLADFQSRSPRMRDFLDIVRRVASSDSSLLVTGETGVGKERLARAIHLESPRSAGPFVPVNCGALTESLLESELFGHTKGAFTGATGDREGHFEAAHGGTIFLDEIGEMPMHLQVKLLTVLQRHEVQRLGANRTVSVDVRVIAATNRDLALDVADKRFREDLFFRLNVIALEIPPVRERIEDLPWFVGRFLRHFAEAHGRAEVQAVSEEALDSMRRYPWPGNVRELVNVIERAVLLCDGDRLQVADLPDVISARGPASAAAAASPESNDPWAGVPMQEARRRVVDEFERAYLENLLKLTGGNLGEVSSRARINPRTLYDKMRRYDLRKEDFR
tara:strand:+ start:1808 stop:3214 length:1407 start_codon:yes stop_codon:yes gene_type:complete